MRADGVDVVPYRPEHREAFRELNVEWISRYFTVEPRDVRDLGDPETHILRSGGAIFIAELDGVPVGACALVREPDGGYELAKMAVTEAARGRGIGRALAEAVISHARELGIGQLELFTNSVLEPAVRLYRSLGFVDAPLGHSDYGRADMRMVLDLTAGNAAPPAGGG